MRIIFIAQVRLSIQGFSDSQCIYTEQQPNSLHKYVVLCKEGLNKYLHDLNDLHILGILFGIDPIISVLIAMVDSREKSKL